MRILFTSQPGSGHWHPLIGLARSLSATGHDVAFAASPKACAAIEANGISCFPVGHDEPEDVVRARRQSLADGSRAEPGVFMVREVFAGSSVRQTLPDMLTIGRTWKPAVVVRENLEFSGFLMAEALDVPHAVVQVTAWRPTLHAHAAEVLDLARARHGLAPDPDPAGMFRHLLLIPRPTGFLDQSILPPSARIIQPLLFDQSGKEGLPAWVDDLPQRPLVFATLGTAFNHVPGVLSSIIAALRDEEISLALTTGRDLDPATLGPPPANVHIERYIPQTLLFPHCDAAVIHGGSGTVMAALRYGLPMVIIPIAADQPLNAQRCAELGVARVIGPADRTPETIREATREVLVNGDYRANAERYREEMARLPGVEHAAGLIERLATRGQIVTGA